LNDREVLEQFVLLDDYDVFASIKVWANHSDKVLSILCKSLVERHLFKIEMTKEDVDKEKMSSLLTEAQQRFGLSEHDAKYLVFDGSTRNSAYNMDHSTIKILYKDGTVMDVAKASDQLNIKQLSNTVIKHFLCFPKELL
jgi:hypothetical protein